MSTSANTSQSAAPDVNWPGWYAAYMVAEEAWTRASDLSNELHPQIPITDEEV